MTLSGIMALILRFFTKFDCFAGQLRHSGWRLTYNVRKIVSPSYSLPLRLLSHNLGLVVAGLRSLWLASHLKPWLKATRVLRQLMTAWHDLQHHGDLVQTTNSLSHIASATDGVRPTSVQSMLWLDSTSPNCIFTLLCSHCFIWCFSESF